MILWVLPWWLHDWRGKMGATRERENMSSRVHKLVKFIPFYHALKWLSPCNALLVFSQIWVMSPSMRMTCSIISFLPFIRRAFSIINICLPWERAFSNKFLEKCLICFKMCGNGKKYIYIYIFLWDMVFVIYIGIICRYFVGHGSCICILGETWSLKIHEKYVWVFCEECVCKIYGSVR